LTPLQAEEMVVQVARKRRRAPPYAETLVPDVLVRISDAKLRALEALRHKPATAAEMARVHGVHRSASLRHLHALEDVGLVERQRAGHRKWVYYSLTPAGTEALRAFASRLR
jgi:DNA-binding MarR family transcriptional regulator